MSKQTLKLNKNKHTDLICYAILLAGLVMRILLAIRYPFSVPMHDIGNISDWEEVTAGHAGYIQYLYMFKVFPQTYANQLYHPPLFHIIGWIIFEIFYKPGADPRGVFEIVQMVNSILASVAAYVAYLIYKKLDIKGVALISATAFISLSPVLINIGEIMNNDCLMTLLSLVCFYFALCWYKKSTLSNIMYTAVFLVLAMLAKTSAVLLAPALAVVFLSIFMRKDTKKFSLIKQFILFAVVSIPLGLSWVIRNKIKYDLPFSYVPSLTPDSYMYVGDKSNVSRFVPFTFRSLKMWADYDMAASEKYNLWSSVVYSLCFEEGLFVTKNAYQNALGIILIFLMTAIITVSTIYLIYGLFNKNINNGIKFSLFLAVLVPVIGIISFFVKFPYSCTASFRYIEVPLILIPAIWGILASKKDDKNAIHKIMSYAFSILSVSSAVITVALYITLLMK